MICLVIGADCSVECVVTDACVALDFYAKNANSLTVIMHERSVNPDFYCPTNTSKICKIQCNNITACDTGMQK